MSTVFAVNDSCNAILLLGRVLNRSHASVLPRVLNGIDEDDIFSYDVETSEVVVCPFDVKLRELITEDPLAVIRPVGELEHT